MKQEVIKYIEKPWGYEKLFTCNDSYALKEIGFKKAPAAPAETRAETGTCLHPVRRDPGGGRQRKRRNRSACIPSGECYEQKPGARHRVTALEDSAIIEVSTPHLDDVIRLEDDYGRQDR